MTRRVVVLDYGSGNVHSAVRALTAAGAEVTLSSDPRDVYEAHGLVVPGVGAFPAVMNLLRAVDAPRLIDRRLAASRPVLGICVGLQVMFARSTEHGGGEGLGQWEGEVRRLDAEVVPHMGWTPVRAHPDSTLMRGLDGEYFYFVHSYAVTVDPFAHMGPPLTPPRVSWAHHGSDFIAAVDNGALCATQFHPEKSSHAGQHLLRNWLGML